MKFISFVSRAKNVNTETYRQIYVGASELDMDILHWQFLKLNKNKNKQINIK